MRFLIDCGFAGDAQCRFRHGLDGALGDGIEVAHALHFVADQFNAEGPRGSGREDVNDAASAGEGASLVDDSGRAVASGIESGQERLDREGCAGAQCRRRDAAAEGALAEGLDVGDDQGSLAGGESGEHAEAGMCGGAVGAALLVRQRLARGEGQNEALRRRGKPGGQIVEHGAGLPGLGRDQ